ncbi:MAG: hypothetical protein P8Y99_00015 [Calditrichaceae bacterium]
MKTKFLIIGLISVLMIGCAAPNMKFSVPSTATIDQPEDKALVYFIRPSNLGYKINAAIYDDENFIGFVPYNQKLPYFAEPGTHLFMVVSEAADFINAELAAGKTYYIKVIPRMGMWRARFSLGAITKEDLQKKEVQQWISTCRLIENKDSADRWAEENEPSVSNKRQAYLEKWNARGDENQPTLNIDDCE